MHEPHHNRLSRRGLLGGVAGAALAGLTSAPAFAAPPSAPGRRPPNVVFISVDDLGWDELGSYGNTFNETPVLDRLARDGMRFTSAYAAAPLCSPTRAALVTGQYPARTGITDFLRGSLRRATNTCRRTSRPCPTSFAPSATPRDWSASGT
ncbi:sulfatase-like hydrolase/transferase [Micromonospora pallida]|uniref:sulfatase-like hydrolase/transferase n=1 Tax=Micromonospora pallida TaxID=145854 RepID=UPI000AA49A85|nr:sulfatase-like hydrolase/transferase [Micromonospora pallida]